MSETKIKIPEGMLEAAAMELSDVGFRSDVIAYDVKRMLKAALRWLSENPIVPTDAQIEEMKIKLVPVHPHWSNIVAEWQRRMFLAPEPETSLPEEWIRACARNVPKGAVTMKIYSAQGILLETVDLEAYRRGQQSK